MTSTRTSANTCSASFRVANYLGAIAELYGPDHAHREARRIVWVYDKCYLDDSCPGRPESGPSP